MTETSWFWGGIVTGDAVLAPYDDDEYTDVLAQFHLWDRSKSGVIGTDHPSFSGNLEVLNPAGNVLRVPTGIAMVDGKLYRNDANIDFAMSVPGAGYNYYSVVLRKTFATQLVRAAMLGPSSVTYPSVTQVDGATWEILLAHARIDNVSVIDVYDRRAWAIKPPIRTEFIPVMTGWNFTLGSELKDYGTGGVGISFIALSDTNITEAYGGFIIPHDWTRGTSIKAYPLMLSQSGPGAKNVYFRNTAARQEYGTGMFVPSMTNTSGYATFALLYGGIIPGPAIFKSTAHYAELPITIDAWCGDFVSLIFRRDGDDPSDTAGPVEFIGWQLEYSPAF